MKARTKHREMRRTCSTCGGDGFVNKNVFQPCRQCLGTGLQEVRCPQCWQWKPVRHFKGKEKSVLARCHECTAKYAGWASKTLAERQAASESRRGLKDDGPLRVFFTHKSKNRKTGPIPVSMTSASSCPPSCAYYARGCYAESHILGLIWRRVSSGEGLTWEQFCDQVRELPRGQIWRHNEAGDLPGFGEELDEHRLVELVGAARGTLGFTYTHKRRSYDALRYATANGLVVNLSADSLGEADALKSEGLPIAVVLPHDAPARGVRTPNGQRVVVCPAQLAANDVTCERCQLCAHATRKSVIGFRAHGVRQNQITEKFVEQLRLPIVS